MIEVGAVGDRATVIFLNVGWGDAHLIRLPSGYLTLIDGGDGSPQGEEIDEPVRWMDRHGYGVLDLMILTHLHEDHLKGLLKVAAVKKVKQAVLPYNWGSLPEEGEVLPLGDAVAEKGFRLAGYYLALVELLRSQGTELIWRTELAEDSTCVVWSREGYTLRHLYPWLGDPLPALEQMESSIRLLAEGDHGPHCIEGLEGFYLDSNHDSSVYLLTADHGAEGEGVLFGADQLGPGWQRLADRRGLTCSVWKVSHHGVDDGYNREILERIRPEAVVIPVDDEAAASMVGQWEELEAAVPVNRYVTGQWPVGQEQVVVRNGPIRVVVGSAV